jgi:hypothetical protein
MRRGDRLDDGHEDVAVVALASLVELAVLSVLAHPELEIAEAAIDAIAQLPADQARLYFHVIMTALPAAIYIRHPDGQSWRNGRS